MGAITVDLNALLANRRRVVSENRIHGIYFLYDQRELVYIGSSVDCRSRIRTHRERKGPGAMTFTHYSILELPNLEVCELRSYEHGLISQIPTRYNRQQLHKADCKRILEYGSCSCQRLAATDHRVITVHPYTRLDGCVSISLTRLRQQNEQCTSRSMAQAE
jgi:hypothetical protein